MTNLLRVSSIATLAALAIAATPAAAAPVSASAQARAKILKPLSLTKDSDLDFGTVVLGTGTFSSNVAVSSASVRTCGASLTCTGTPTAAAFTVNGSNNQVVTISVTPPANLTNGTGGTIALTLGAVPATVTLPNSGTAGTSFSFGGSIAVSDTTPDGNYSGTVNVTADYQ